MKVCRTIAELRAAVAAYRAQGEKRPVGFVPTMGYLHDGHASLMARARAECGLTVLSIFVNPLQFGPGEDFERYPRNEAGDLALARENGIDVVFLPEAAEMYPSPIRTKVHITEVTERLCGASRPGHFDGVGTVVAKLFHIVQPDRAYFGLKDAQQVAVIQTMVDDLNMPVTLVPCETVREPDGLALSSRNVYLSAEERAQATVLSEALELAERLVRDEASNGCTVGEMMEQVTGRIASASLAELDYAEATSYPALMPLPPEAALHELSGSFLVALAVRFGRTRLIDNRLFPIKGGDFDV